MSGEKHLYENNLLNVSDACCMAIKLVYNLFKLFPTSKVSFNNMFILWVFSQ
jgi:hypothetical protein